MSENPEKDGQVEVIFTTKLPERYQIPNDPIVVPSSSGRYALSELVNHIMENEKPMSLDFIVDGQFLRMSLQQYLTSSGKTAETTLELEYLLAMPQPESHEIDTNEDWISAIKCMEDGTVIVSSYDGSIWLYSGEPLTRQREIKMNLGPLKCVDSVQHTELLMAVGSKSGIVALNGASNVQGDVHTDSVDCIKFNEDASQLASGGADGMVVIWQVDEHVGPKRSRDNLASRAEMDAGAPVTCLRWSGRVLLSAGLDTQITVWDPLAGASICKLPVGAPISALSLSKEHIACAHHDGRISFWHRPSAWEGALENAGRVKVSKRAITGVELGGSYDAFASTSQDGGLKLTDARARVPLASSSEETRLMCLCWRPNRDEVVTGSSDGKVRLHTFARKAELNAGA